MQYNIENMTHIIADNIKKLQIMNVRYTDVIGYLLIALEQLIKLCEELHA